MVDAVAYENKKDALWRMPSWWPINVGCKGLFPSVSMAHGLVYSDGSGDRDRHVRMTINTAICPYQAAQGIESCTSEAIDLTLGLIAAAPDMYKALRAMVNATTQSPQTAATRTAYMRAKYVLEQIEKPVPPSPEGFQT